MRLKVVILRQHARAHQFLRKDLHEVQQIFRLVVADVVQRIGRNGQAIFANRLLRRVLHHANDTLYDVVNVGEVALAVAIVEDLDGLALMQLVGEAKVGHVRPSCRAIDREKAQTRAGDVVKLGVGMGHELVALLGGSVKTNGIVHLVVCAVGYLFIAAINRA